jgi:hypothetical protein
MKTVWSTVKIAEVTCPICGAICPVEHHEAFNMRVQGHCSHCGASYYPTADDGEMLFCSQTRVKVMAIGERCSCGGKKSYNIITKRMMCDECEG